MQWILSFCCYTLFSQYTVALIHWAWHSSYVNYTNYNTAITWRQNKAIYTCQILSTLLTMNFIVFWEWRHENVYILWAKSSYVPLKPRKLPQKEMVKKSLKSIHFSFDKANFLYFLVIFNHMCSSLDTILHFLYNSR